MNLIQEAFPNTSSLYQAWGILEGAFWKEPWVAWVPHSEGNSEGSGKGLFLHRLGLGRRTHRGRCQSRKGQSRKGHDSKGTPKVVAKGGATRQEP